MLFPAIITALACYLLGNLNGAVLVSFMMHDDVRTHGSGNAGLTNFIRNYGASRSTMVIAIDVIKAVLACFMAGLIFEAHDMVLEGRTLGGIFVMLGHDFPALLGFKGGKGILSGVTVALMMDWRLGLFVFSIFLVAYALTKYVSLGSVLSSGSFGFLYAWFHRDSLFPILVGFTLSGLIVWMHRGNIKRLIKGEERKTNLFGKGKSK